MSNRLHEAKGQSFNVTVQKNVKIVSAYGLRKCPKLVEEIAQSFSNPLIPCTVRVEALKALCEEAKNPLSVYGCTEAGVVSVLSDMITDTDFDTRLYASEALTILAQDANGLDAILRDEAVPGILAGFSDPSEDVRGNVYDCVRLVTRTADGVDACNNSGVAKALVGAILSENDAMRRILLPALYNIAGSDSGLVDSLACGAVEVCVRLLGSSDIAVVAASAKALGFICLDGRGKTDALAHGAISSLFDVVTRSIAPSGMAEANIQSMWASALMALTSITSTDEGKRQCDKDEYINAVVDLLCDESEGLSPKMRPQTTCNRLVQLNCVKVIANVAVFPDIRRKLLNQSNNRCLKKLTVMKEGGDPLLRRHADTAIMAVNWTP